MQQVRERDISPLPFLNPDPYYQRRSPSIERDMSPLGLILAVVLLLILLGGLPAMGFHSYGWYPSGGIGLVIVILLLVLFLR